MKNDMRHKLQNTPQYGVTAITAAAHNATGATLIAATIQDGVTGTVMVTCANADYVVWLPTPVIGTRLRIVVGANGFELRSNSPLTVAINGGTGAAVELAIGATEMVEVECIDEYNWVALIHTGTGITGITAPSAA